jgi:hypothetical protein
VVLPLQVHLLASTQKKGISMTGAVEAVAVHDEQMQLQGGHYEAQDVRDEDVGVAAYYESIGGPREGVEPRHEGAVVRQRGGGLVPNHCLELRQRGCESANLQGGREGGSGVEKKKQKYTRKKSGSE